MPRKALIGNTLLLAVAALCVPIFLSACLFVAYPTVTYAPGVALGDTPEEVHCFRVDAKVRTFNRLVLGPNVESFTVRQIPVSAKGNVEGQLSISIATGWIGLVDNRTSHALHLILYRRGFELEDIESWASRDQIKWKQAVGVNAREAAIDKLSSLERFESRGAISNLEPSENSWSSDLDCRFKSTGYERILKLAASEYETLANSELGEGPGADELRKRLLEKAQKLKSILDEGQSSKKQISETD